MGLDGADEKCNDLARGRVEGTYMAWLSSAEKSAKDRIGEELEGFGGCFVLADESKTVVAVGWTDMHGGLLSGELVHPINVTEEGTVVSDTVWTGTKMDGEAVAGMLPLGYCGDWTNQSSAICTLVTPCGRIGSTQFGGEGWTNQAGSSCEKTHRIYCIQVEP